ncbi:MAG: tetratricopeptide repeat protein [Bacteroidetes bacterium]|nr:tetratricopeptide repeat protein [Bacteroidota bacterium]
MSSKPNNVSFKNGLAISYEKLGATHSSLGNLAKALEFFEKDIELTKELYALQPNNVSFKNGLAVSFVKLGSFHEDKLEDTNTAINYYKQSELLWTELVSDFPKYPEFKSNLQWIKKKLASLK